MTMYIVAIIFLLLSLCILFARAAAGPHRFHRLQAINSMSTIIMLIIAVHGFLNGRPEFLDLAIVFSLTSTIGMVAVFKFVKFQKLGWPTEAKDDRGDI
ncbi:MAG: monovalent cation/H+ antiporter complex subunit F [Alphaproteobacteria bacterium]